MNIWSADVYSGRVESKEKNKKLKRGGTGYTDRSVNTINVISRNNCEI